MGLSSEQVLKFIPLDTWTQVFLIPGSKPNNKGTYLISTNEKYLKRCNDMYNMALNSCKFKKVVSYQLMGLVALEIEGLWCRGRMISYNKFLDNNTVVQLIDSGSIVKKQLCDLYQLPDNYKYDPLCLMIKPVNDIICNKYGRFCVQPLLLESELHKNYVVVNTKSVDEVNEVDSDVNFEEIKIEESIYSVNNTLDLCPIQKSDYIQNNSDFEYKCIIEFSNELVKMINKETLLGNINIDLNNIFTQIADMLKNLSLEYIDFQSYPVFVKKFIECQNYKRKNIKTIHQSKIKDFKSSVDNLFKNGSVVEFCYGINIDFVYIRSYDQKIKYSNEMKQFYVYYDKKENLKVKTNVNKGELVAALLTCYNEIHRAEILNIKESKKLGSLYLCYFVDIGCKKYVGFNEIFYLTEEAKNVPYLAHKVGLNNDPFNNTMQLKYLKYYFDQLYLQPLVIEFEELDPNSLNKVILKNKTNNMSIYLEVTEFFQKTLSSFKFSNDEKTQLNISEYFNFNNLLKNGTIVCITYFHSINQIFIRINTPESIEYCDKLVADVNHFYNNVKELNHRKNPKIGEKVAVKSSKNSIFRAIVLKKVDKITCAVQFIDFGVIECIKDDAIFVLPYIFRQMPQCVVKVGLNVSLPINKINKYYFRQLIKLSVPLIVEFDEEDPLGFQNVVLKKCSSGTNICKEL